jgi:transcriptional regulator GlxA family with amidase domain
MQIAIVVYPGMTGLDALGPYEVLHGMRGAEVRFVWKEVGPVVADSGVLVLGATHRFDETMRPDVVLVPGSSVRTATLMADTEVRDWLRAVHPHTRFTTSVCSGALILAAAGLLEGRAATSHWAALPLLKQFGVDPRPLERVVRDGKLWTAAGVSAGIDLALALVAELDGAESAQVLQLLIEYDPQPPFDAGHMTKASPAVRQRAEREMRQQALSAREVGAVSKTLLRRWLSVLHAKVRREPKSLDHRHVPKH